MFLYKGDIIRALYNGYLQTMVMGRLPCAGVKSLRTWLKLKGQKKRRTWTPERDGSDSFCCYAASDNKSVVGCSIVSFSLFDETCAVLSCSDRCRHSQGSDYMSRCRDRRSGSKVAERTHWVRLRELRMSPVYTHMPVPGWWKSFLTRNIVGLTRATRSEQRSGGAHRKGQFWLPLASCVVVSRFSRFLRLFSVNYSLCHLAR